MKTVKHNMWHSEVISSSLISLVFFQSILFCSILVLHVKYISLSGRCHLTITQHLFCSLFCVGELLFTFVFPCFIQSSEFRYFVSKKWLTKFQSCMEPGNKSIAGRPLIDWFATGMYIIVSQMMRTSFSCMFLQGLLQTQTSCVVMEVSHQSLEKWA